MLLSARHCGLVFPQLHVARFVKKGQQGEQPLSQRKRTSSRDYGSDSDYDDDDDDEDYDDDEVEEAEVEFDEEEEEEEEDREFDEEDGDENMGDDHDDDEVREDANMAEGQFKAVNAKGVKFSPDVEKRGKRMKRMRRMTRSMSSVKGKLGKAGAKAKAKVKEAPDRAKEKAKAAAIVARFVVRRGRQKAKRARQKARENIGTATDKAKETLHSRGPIGAAKAAASKVGGGMKMGVEKTKEAAKERIAGARALGTAVKRKARTKKEGLKERIENRGRPRRASRMRRRTKSGDVDDEWADEDEEDEEDEEWWEGDGQQRSHSRGNKGASGGRETLPGALSWEAPMRQLLGVEYESLTELVSAQAALEERLSPRLSIMERQRQRLHFALRQIEQAMDKAAPGGHGTSGGGLHAAAASRAATPVLVGETVR
jgi:hypothetical protein